jgi:hypothetical protein
VSVDPSERAKSRAEWWLQRAGLDSRPAVVEWLARVLDAFAREAVEAERASRDPKDER